MNLDEFDNVEIYEAPVEMAFSALDIQPDVIVVDPPRGGLTRPALQGILRLAPTWLVYISCDPATLARDSRYLHDAGFSLRHIAPFDMFPQTYHIESISLWELAARSRKG